MKWHVPIFCLFYLSSFSQQSSIDSLKKELLNTKEDTSKANILYDISYLYRRFDYDSALHYAMLLLQQSKARFPRGEMRA